MSKQYELTTLRDIFDKVPADRIKDCFLELGTLLAQTKLASELAGASADSVTIDFPIVWIDDGKGDLRMELEVDDGEALVIETKLEPQDGR